MYTFCSHNPSSITKKQEFTSTIIGRKVLNKLDNRQGEILSFDEMNNKHVIRLYNEGEKEKEGKNEDKLMDFSLDNFTFLSTPWYRYAEISFTYILAMLSSNEALK